MIHEDLSSEKLPWRGNFPQRDCFVGSSPSMAASQKLKSSYKNDMYQLVSELKISKLQKSSSRLL